MIILIIMEIRYKLIKIIYLYNHENKIVTFYYIFKILVFILENFKPTNFLTNLTNSLYFYIIYIL